MSVLRPYQETMIHSADDALIKGMNRILWQSSTGTGKTRVFSHLPTRLQWAQRLARAPKMLVIAHREELLHQACSTIEQFNPDLLVMIEAAELCAAPMADVVVAGIQTLAARDFRRLKRLLTEVGKFDIVVVDEAHHSTAASYRGALVHLGFLPPEDLAVEGEGADQAATDAQVAFMKAQLATWDSRAPKDRVLIGVTATPNRADGQGLAAVFQTLAFSYAIKDAIRDGWLVPIVPWSIETKTSLDKVRTTAGEFNQKDLADAVNNPRRNQMAVQAWKEYAAGRSTLAFAVDLKHVDDMIEAFTLAGVGAMGVSGETPREQRREILASFSRGDFPVLVNCMVLTEGTDLPRTSCILNLRPTKSASLFEQIVGRGLRTFDGKEDCIMIDLVDSSSRHSLVTAAVLYGLPPKLAVKGKRLDHVASEFDALRDKLGSLDDILAHSLEPMTLEQLGALARKVDFLKPLDLGTFGAGRTLAWVKTSEDAFRISYPINDGHEVVEVVRGLLDQWEVVITNRPSDRVSQTKQRTLAVNCSTADEAAIAAERYVRADRPAAAKLKAKGAGWMSNAASSPQVAYLMKLGVPRHAIPHDLTSGDASQWIDQMKARAAR